MDGKASNLPLFADVVENYAEYAEDDATCHARATTLRKACFKNPTSPQIGYGSVTASFNDGPARTDEWSNLCAIKFGPENNCPAQRQAVKADTALLNEYSNHVEEQNSEED